MATCELLEPKQCNHIAIVFIIIRQKGTKRLLFLFVEALQSVAENLGLLNRVTHSFQRRTLIIRESVMNVVRRLRSRMELA